MKSTHHIRSRMRWLIISMGMMWAMLASAQSNINKIEYFFDTDPGFGNGTNVTVATPSANISSLSFIANLPAAAGFHTFCVRSRNANGGWSLTSSSNLIRYQAQTAALGPNTRINKLEYFFDTDPGVGLGTNVPVTASTDISNLAVPVSISSLSGGFHMLYIRSRDSLGRWSITNNSNFLKYQAQTAALGPVVPVNKIEYFFDTDPGFGLGTNVPVTAATDINNLAIPVSLATLNGGFHMLYVRSRDSLGRWSITSNSALLKYLSQTAALGPVVNVNKMEYFIDTDPGFGLGTNVPVTSSTDINGLAVSVNLASINPGYHTLYIRTRDSLGRWSITGNSNFIKYQSQTASLGPLDKIVRLEYFIDIDPGVGHASQVSFTPIQDLNNYVFVANLSTVSSGAHKLYVRSIDSLGKWSLTNYGSFNGGTLQPPTATITVAGTQPLCAGTGYLRVNRDASPIATYQWKLGTTNVGTNDTIFYPTSSGTYTVVVTNTAGTATSSPVTITVNPAPTASISAGGPLAFCQGGSVLLSVNQTANASYSWKLNGGSIGGATSYSYSATSSGVYNVLVTGTNGCSTASARDTVVVTPGVTPTIVVTANQTSICTNTLDSFFATITNGGSNPTYIWKKNGVTVGGNSPVYFSSTLANNDTVSCILTSNAVCATPSVLTSNKIIMTVSTVSAPSVSITPTTPSVCSGSAVSFMASTINGGSAPTYQWYVNGSLQGSTSNPFVTSSLSNNDSVWTVMTSNSSCASLPTAMSNHAKVTVNSTVTPFVAVVVSSSTICASAVDTFTATPINGGASPFYQWYRNGILQVGNTSRFITSLSNNDSVWCVMTSNAACPSPTTATSSHVRVNVISTVVPTISVSASQTTICGGDSVTFTASITNGGANPVYQWKKNNANVGSNSATYGSITLANGDSVWCVLTSNAACASPASVASNHIRMTVNQVTAPSNTVTASQTSICAGTNVTFTSTVTNGGTNPTYLWYKNSVLQASTASTYSSSALSNNDTVWCLITSNSPCASVPTAMSNKIVITVSPTVTPSVSITSSFLTICTSASDTFRAVPVNGGIAPVYQWYRNGVLQVGNTAIFITTSLSNNDSVWCVMTSGAACPSPATATSNKIRIAVNSYVTPTIVVSASPGSICAGDSVTYTASISNGGPSPTYVWKKNGVTVGGNSAVYGTRAILSGDSVWCIMTSNVPCPTTSTVTSNKVRITVNSIVTPTVSINASQTTICIGNTVNFSATITNGGANPSYAWYKNGSLVSVGSAGYSDNGLANNDSVWCIMTSSNACASPASVSSNHIIITITSAVVPAVTVSTPLTTVCAGTSVTFTANPVNGGSNPGYQWYKNGVLQAGNSGTYTPASLTTNDSVWCIMTSNASCVSPATATSTHVHMTVTPIVVPAITVTAVPSNICVGDSVTFTTSITNGGSNPTYQWKKNGVNIGSGSSIYGTRNILSTDSVWCVLTSTATCASPTVISSNHVRVTVNPIVAPTISVSASQTTICPGNAVNFTASITNGGSNPSYQWYKNGIVVSTSGAIYSSSSLANNDSIWCVLTSSNACASPSSASSGHIIITITTSVTPSVSISTSLPVVCAATPVTFTASPTNGGSPTYQWYKNSLLQSGNTGTYTTTSLADNDTVWCIMTSNALCVSPATAVSNRLVMIVNPVIVPAISVAASVSTICAGDSVTYTATITNGGTNPFYQWIKNGSTIGAGGPTYGTRNIASTDSVWCVLTSSAACAAPSVINSNHVRIIVNPIVSPTITVSASQSAICAGNTVIFTATVNNGGPNPSFTWYKNGIVVSTNGTTYSDNTLTDNDSVWCLLVSNASCASTNTAMSNHVIITLTTTVVPSVSVTTSSDSVCSGSSVTYTATPVNGGTSPLIQWYRNGILQSNTGINYTINSLTTTDSVRCMLTSSVACASPAIATSASVQIFVIQPSQSGYTATICPGNIYFFGGHSLSQAGTYRDTLTAVSTCDSIITLTLNVAAQSMQTINSAICPGDSFDFRGVTLYQGGVYTDTLYGASMSGCDSIIQLSLSIRPILTGVQYDTVCYGGTVVFDGRTLHLSGTYTDTLTGSNGCDSINTMVLTISPQVTFSYNDYICQGHSYTFHGHLLNTAGTYADTLQTVHGCDSIVSVTLNVRSTFTTNITDTVCDGDIFVYHGRNLTVGGIYRDTFPAINTCDSIVVLNFVVNPKPAPVATLQGISGLHTSGYSGYQWLYNNTVINGATGQTYTATHNGQYRVIVFNTFGCSDTSAAVGVTHVGIDDPAITSILIYPNPAEHIIRIEAEGLHPNTTLLLIDAIGRTVYQQDISLDNIKEAIDISSFASGVYILALRDSEKIYVSHLVVKN